MVNLIFAVPENVTTIQDKILYIDSLTDVGFGGVLGILFLFLIGGILFLMMKRFAMEKAFAASMFITSIMAILLAVFGLLSSGIVTISILLFAVSLFLLIRATDNPAF